MGAILQWKMKAKFGRKRHEIDKNLGKKGLELKERYIKQKHENIWEFGGKRGIRAEREGHRQGHKEYWINVDENDRKIWNGGWDKMWSNGGI